MNKKKVAIYARFSTDQQRDTSIEDQERRCREVAARHNFDEEAIVVYEDKAISGTAKFTAFRDGYQGLMEAWDEGEIDVLVVDEFSRLSRDGLVLKELQRKIEDTGIRVITADGLDSNSPVWHLAVGMASVISEQSIRDTQFRVVRGMIGQLERGFMIAPPAYGYNLAQQFDNNNEHVGSYWEIDEEQSKIVQEIFQMRAQGKAVGAIAKELNERGVSTPRLGSKGGYWRPGTIHRILNNSIYRGVFQWHGSPVYKAQAKKKKKDPEIREFDRPQLRLVDDETWFICNRKRISRTGRGGGKHAFSKLVNCGTCSAVLTLTTGGNSPTLYCAQCGQARRVGIARGHTGHLTATGLQHVLNAAIAELLSPPVVNCFRERMKRRLTDGVEEDLKQAKCKRDHWSRACERVASMILYTDDELLKSKYNEAKESLSQWQEKVEQLESRKMKTDREAVEKQLTVDPSELLKHLWQADLPPERTRAMLARVFEEIVFENKPERFVAIVRIKLSAGAATALVTNTKVIDTEATTMRFRLATGPSRPTKWVVTRIENDEDMQDAS